MPVCSPGRGGLSIEKQTRAKQNPVGGGLSQPLKPHFAAADVRRRSVHRSVHQPSTVGSTLSPSAVMAGVSGQKPDANANGASNFDNHLDCSKLRIFAEKFIFRQTDNRRDHTPSPTELTVLFALQLSAFRFPCRAEASTKADPYPLSKTMLLRAHGPLLHLSVGSQ